MSAEKKGEVFGFILYQVLEGLLTSGASAALKSGKAAMIVAKLEKFEVITKNPQLARAVTKLVELLEKGKVAEEALKIEKGLAKGGRRSKKRRI